MESSPIPNINPINCKLDGNTEVYAFAPSTHHESSLAGKIGVFDDLNIGQMGTEQTDPQWNDRLMIWWGIGKPRCSCFINERPINGIERRVKDHQAQQYFMIINALSPWLSILTSRKMDQKLWTGFTSTLGESWNDHWNTHTALLSSRGAVHDLYCAFK